MIVISLSSIAVLSVVFGLSESFAMAVTSRYVDTRDGMTDIEQNIFYFTVQRKIVCTRRMVANQQTVVSFPCEKRLRLMLLPALCFVFGW